MQGENLYVDYFLTTSTQYNVYLLQNDKLKQKRCHLGLGLGLI